METNDAGLHGFMFYNAGSKIDEQWPFSISETSAGFNADDGKGAHSIGKYNFIAPKQGWVFVPIEIKSGSETLRVNFPEDVKRKYGTRGIVMLDPRHNPGIEDGDKDLSTYPVAPTEELVIARAERLWDGFLERVCSQHFDDVQNSMAQGNRPRAASGFTVHALREKGYRDPAADFLKGLRNGQTGTVPQNGSSSSEMIGLVRGIAEQNQLTTKLVLALASGQKIDPDLLKALVSPGEAARPQTPEVPVEVPVNAGTIEVVDSAPQSPLQARIQNRSDDGYVRGVGNLDKGTLKIKDVVLPKGERTKAAARDL